MKIDAKRRANQAIACFALFCTVMQPTYALTLATEPLFLANRVPPKVMLTLSKDQQLYKKAYNDYSDLDGDGIVETTYKHSITYYGYFDSIKCYNYNTANERFEPVSITTSTVTNPDGTTKPGPAYCDDSTGRWSGNFLNWVSMSRMDAVRKLLYGGLRQVDTATDTVLERSYLPTDAHSWAKFYDGADISRLTPFTVNSTPSQFDIQTASAVTLTKTSQDLTLSFKTNITNVVVGDQLKIARQGKADEFMYGAVLAIPSSKSITIRVNAIGVADAGVGHSDANWTITNLSTTGISFCNTTPGASGSHSQTNTNAPMIRAAKGNFALWSANEVFQCHWSEETTYQQSGFNGVRSNGNQAALSEINASAENPSRATHGLGRSGTDQGQYNARVKACVSDALRGNENCQRYPNGNLKPIGLLQTYGSTIDFGLMTGSYAKNISGGVLRKQVGTFSDEVNAATDGTFTATVGIAKTLDKMRIYGYDYTSGTYIPDDACSYQLTSISEGNCTSWGNPMSEVYYEAIRYFAAKTDNQATAAYTYTSAGSKDAALGLSYVPWKSQITQTNVCSRLNVLVFNASVSTNDDDLRNQVAADINTSSTVRELTNAVGDAEQITNQNFYIGKLVGDAATSPGFELCTAKNVAAFGDVSGICPEGPTLAGSYLLAGIARQARTKVLRTDLNTNGDPNALKVTSYGIQLASNTPSLEIALPGKPGQKVVIQPIYRLDLGGSKVGGGSLVDIKYVRTSVVGSRSTGKVYINWEDSEQGGDYDQDMWGTLEWDLDAAANTIKITTNAISAATANPQGFGYTIGGTTKDGPHFHSGIYGFNFADTVVAQPANFAGCSNCRVASDTSGQRGEQSVTYTLSGNANVAGNLKDPLWYLAKYGGFDDRNQNGQLDAGEWDVQNNLTGASGPDGVPDTYFLVTNPLGLEAALERAFRGISQQGSGTAIASNAGSIRIGSAVYTARFTTSAWSGQLSAFLLNSDGTLKPEEWEASAKLPTPDKRVILTYRNDAASRTGVPFRWPADPANLTATDIPKTLVDALNAKPDGTGPDGRGQQRLNYLRGDASQEGNALTSFRIRTSKLGDIVNSTPIFVPSVPNQVTLDNSYLAFQKTFLGSPRTPMVYVAANDGMIHGFDASVSTVNPDGTTSPSATGGTERFAYVPSKTFSGLNQLTNPNYVHRYYADGSPAVADVKTNNQWKTVLVSTLGAGGRGLVALDITNPPPPLKSTDNDSTSTESASTPKVLWEFNVEDDVPSTVAQNAGAKPYGLGYMLGTPVIRKMANGKWAAIVSGGVNNTEAVPGVGSGGDGKGYIYIIFLDGPKLNSGRNWEWGVDYVRLDTGTIGTPGTPDALAQPFAADVNSDGAVDYLYAGDILGNFWKFDVSDTDASKWSSSKNSVVLFAAGASQPITAPAQGIVHPTGKGFLIMFGTGKYLEPSDPLPPYTTQTFYGIWDKDDKPNNIGAQTTVTAKSQLFQQVINSASSGGSTYRYVTQPTGVTRKGPDWTTQMGWYMDLPLSGERSVFEPLVASRRLVFSTLVPSGSACDFGGTSYIMVVNPATGGEFDTAVLDLNHDGKFTIADSIVNGHYAIGFESGVGITVTPRMLVGGVPTGQTVGADTTLLFNDNTARVAGPGNRRGNLCATGARGTTLCTGFGVGRDSGRATWREVTKQ